MFTEIYILIFEIRGIQNLFSAIDDAYYKLELHNTHELGVNILILNFLISSHVLIRIFMYSYLPT